MIVSGQPRTKAAPTSAPLKGRFRRWLRRKPVRRGLVLIHRWTSLVLGLLLVIETTSGALLLYRGEYFHATNDDFYQYTGSANPVTPQQALGIVTKAHPEFAAAWVSADNGVLAVGDADYAKVYAVDPGTGHVNGMADLDGGTMGLLTNLHDCGLTCKSYPGYVSWLAEPVPALGMTWLDGVTWGALVLALLGLVMILLAITGVITWWPGFRRLSHGFRVRTGKGRFARDYDLHNLLGIVGVPMIFLWGVTGAAFELPVVENAWLAVTGGHAADPQRYKFTANPPAPGAGEVGLDAAEAVALRQVPGEVRYAVAATPATGYYSVSVAREGYAPYDHRAFFGGDVTVYVDSHDPAHTSIVGDGKGEPAANTLYDKVFEPAHFGWMVNGWWRVLWFLFGLTPLALMVTGVSTWLYRSSSKRRRRRARAAT
ncbi:PepSY-associated TM helix domain-containing protein [Amycolatopsis sp. H20-H5]|uniref:PepSY-associated TM helix domain-containing protein n=1 Tax=Amycolatopsis sp. H20-H5 TaxID=3046309 RepID=UPI002DBFB615|nr:PepSY-associated TM helix domain-containing protein [Amycolatopsis sp. H20-H5]MEC3973828.1 PepSY-associated TM helix domain-containing protein [Amycolatopsis sp. H20-H5]